MQCLGRPCLSMAGGNAIVLFARLVDEAGRPVRPSDVATIEYSIRQLDAHTRPAADCEESRIGLEVCDVILPALVIDKLWTLDSVGYNFRHDVVELADFASKEFSRRVEVRYVLVLTNNTPVILRFHLKLA